jgi:hypothetical protein
LSEFPDIVPVAIPVVTAGKVDGGHCMALSWVDDVVERQQYCQLFNS